MPLQGIIYYPGQKGSLAMKRKRRLSTLLCGALLILALGSVPAARTTAAELGVDSGVTLQLVDNDDRNVILAGVPAPDGIGAFTLQSARIGFPTSSRGQIETSLGFT